MTIKHTLTITVGAVCFRVSSTSAPLIVSIAAAVVLVLTGALFWGSTVAPAHPYSPDGMTFGAPGTITPLVDV